MAENTNTPELSLTDIRSALRGEPTPQAEPITETVETATETTENPLVETEKPAEAEATPEAPKADKRERRFSELTKRAKEAEERALTLARELETLRSTPKPAEAAKPAVASTDDKPKPPAANSWEGTWEELENARLKYAEDLAAWSVRDALNKRDAEAKQAKVKAQAEKVQQTWQQQVDAATELHEDMESAIKSVGDVVGRMGIADVIRESEVGAEIVLQLHRDKGALDKLSDMSMASAARFIGRIEDQILSKRSPAEVTKTSTGKALPKPPAVVGGAPSGDAGKVDLDKADFGVFRANVRKMLRK